MATANVIATNERGNEGMAEQAVLQRITSAALVIGGVIALASSFDPPSDLGSPTVWAWVRALGILFVLLGFSNVHHYLRIGASAAWARVGVQCLLISSAGLIAAEGLLAGSLPASIQGVPLTDAVTDMQDLVQALSFAALSAIGLAMALSNIFSAWCGRGLLLFGALAAATAAARSLLEPVAGLDGAAAGAAGLVGVGVIAVGVWSAKQAWAEESET